MEFEKKNTINWDQRWEELETICEKNIKKKKQR